MTTTDPAPASMGGPLSEAERLAEIQSRLDAASKKTTIDVHAGGSTLRATATGGDRGFFVDGFSDLVTAAIGDMGPLKVTVADDEDGQDATLALHARDDIEFLLELVGVLEGQLATARQQQLCAVVGAYVAWDIDNAKRNDLPITHSIADKSEGKLRGAMATFQELLVALGEIEGDEDLEEVWELVEAEMQSAGSALGLDGGDPDA